MKTEKSYIRVYLTDLAAYNDGFLKGDWVELHKNFDLASELETLNIKSEFFISDFETNLNIHICEYAGMDELKQLGELVDAINDNDIDSGVADVIIGTEYNLNKAIEIIKDGDFMLYELNPYNNKGITDEDLDEALGYCLVEECGVLDDAPDFVKGYFDYQSYGHDVRSEMTGDYTKDGKYFVRLD